MYVQFELITGLRIKSVDVIQDAVFNWAKQYSVNKYQTKIHKGMLRLTFDNNQHYSVFAMTWNPEQLVYFNYTIIEPMKTRQSQTFSV
jgi:hypothetical protein